MFFPESSMISIDILYDIHLISYMRSYALYIPYIPMKLLDQFSTEPKKWPQRDPAEVDEFIPCHPREWWDDPRCQVDVFLSTNK